MAEASAELEKPQLQPVTQSWIDQRVFDLYDDYCHGRMDRRSFLAQAADRDRRGARQEGTAVDSAVAVFVIEVEHTLIDPALRDGLQLRFFQFSGCFGHHPLLRSSHTVACKP